MQQDAKYKGYVWSLLRPVNFILLPCTLLKVLNSCKIHVCLVFNSLMNRLGCTTALLMNGDIAHLYLLSMKYFVLRVDKLPTRLSGCPGTSGRCLRHHHLHPIDVHVVLLRKSRPQSTFSFLSLTANCIEGLCKKEKDRPNNVK